MYPPLVILTDKDNYIELPKSLEVVNTLIEALQVVQQQCKEDNNEPSKIEITL